MPGEEIYYLSLTELAKRIETKQLSPVELTQAYLCLLYTSPSPRDA